MHTGFQKQTHLYSHANAHTTHVHLLTPDNSETIVSPKEVFYTSSRSAGSLNNPLMKSKPVHTCAMHHNHLQTQENKQRTFTLQKKTYLSQVKDVRLLDRVSASGSLTLSLTLPPAASAGELQPLLHSSSNSLTSPLVLRWWWCLEVLGRR